MQDTLKKVYSRKKEFKGSDNAFDQKRAMVRLARPPRLEPLKANSNLSQNLPAEVVYSKDTLRWMKERQFQFKTDPLLPPINR